MVRHAVFAAASAVAAFALPGAADAAVINVATSTDTPGTCSLRDAVTAANTDAAFGGCPAGDGADQIRLDATTYTLTRDVPGHTDEDANSTGDLDVSSELTIAGAGPGATTIDGGHIGRVLQVLASGKLTLDGVRVTDGLTTSGGPGLDGESHDPASPGSGLTGGLGGNGGGIASAGTLTVTHSSVSGNATGNGGHGGNGHGADGNGIIGTASSGFGGDGGHAGHGGGVYSTGPLTITASTIDGNTTGSGGAAGDGTGGVGTAGNASGRSVGGEGGQGGSGGGVLSTGPTTITGTTVSGNTTSNGGAGGDGHGGAGNSAGGAGGDGTGGLGGSGGDGGGIWYDALLTASEDTISGNTTGAADFGGQGFGGTGGGASASGKGTGGNGGRGGEGGGLYGAGPTTQNSDLQRSLVASNHTGGGGHGGNGQAIGGTELGGDGGRGGGGGGLVSNAPVAFAVNVTFTGNTTGQGGDRGTGPPLSGTSTYGLGGAGGSGGAVIGKGGFVGLLQTTISGNTQGHGGAGNVAGANGQGAIRNAGGSVAVGESIADGTCSGTIGDSGNNLVTFGSTCPGELGDPKLGPLQDNGGPTMTMAIGVTGDAIDSVPPNSGNCESATDQRGATRPSLLRCDAGAYEVAPPTATTGDATAISGTTAGAGGTLDPRGLRTRWYVEYGTTTGYGKVTADQFANGSAAVVATTLSGLTPLTTYHYRLVAVGPDGISTGADKTFTTTKAPIAPELSMLRLKPKKFRVKGKKPRGTTISYADTLAAVTTLTVLKPKRGVRIKGGRCLKPTKKRHGKRCTRFVAVGGFTHRDVAGPNKLRWTGKVGRRTLKPGSYKMRALPRLGAVKGKAVTASFRVLRPRR